MAYHVYSQVDNTMPDVLDRIKSDVIRGINAGWECQGGVSVTTSLDGRYIASQAMVIRKGAAQEGGKRMPKTPTRRSLPLPPKSRGGNRRTRKNRK